MEQKTPAVFVVDGKAVNPDGTPAEGFEVTPTKTTKHGTDEQSGGGNKLVPAKAEEEKPAEPGKSQKPAEPGK